jgi:hypothetical protein
MNVMIVVVFVVQLMIDVSGRAKAVSGFSDHASACSPDPFLGWRNNPS